jgi:hypothetical protein
LADVLRRIVEINNRRDGLNATLPAIPRAAPAADQKQAANGNAGGDLVSAIEGANDDITNSTDHSIDAVNNFAHHVAKQNERLQAALHRNATLLQMNS